MPHMPDCSLEGIQSTEWGTVAQKAGQVTTAVALGMGIVGFFFGQLLGSIFAFLVAFLLATWELPWIYKCAGPCMRLTDLLNHRAGFKQAWVRAVAHGVLSIFLFWNTTLQIITGVCMGGTALLYALAALTGHGDLEVPDGPPVPPGGGATESTAFGTFT